MSKCVKKILLHNKVIGFESLPTLARSIWCHPKKNYQNNRHLFMSFEINYLSDTNLAIKANLKHYHHIESGLSVHSDTKINGIFESSPLELDESVNLIKNENNKNQLDICYLLTISQPYYSSTSFSLKFREGDDSRSLSNNFWMYLKEGEDSRIQRLSNMLLIESKIN